MSNAMAELDPNIHQPARLRILMLLSGVDIADFTFLHKTSVGQELSLLPRWPNSPSATALRTCQAEWVALQTSMQ